MALRNLVGSFCHTYVLVIHCSENNLWFRKQAEQYYTEAILEATRNKDILAEDMESRFFCFPHFVHGRSFKERFVKTLHCPDSVAKV